MKRITSYLLSWAFYGIGSVAGKLGLGWMYQKAMSVSSNIQNWGGRGPWSSVD